MKRRVLTAMCLAILAIAPAAAEGWEYDLLMYAWLTGLDGTIGIADVGEQPVSATFDDLVGYVDFAMAGHFEAKTTKGLLLSDVSFTALSETRDASVINQTVRVDLDIDQWILEFGGGYRATEEIDLLLVGRYYILDLGATSTSIVGESTGDATQNWGDIYLGARYKKLLREKWLFSLRGDIGAGGSQFAWFGNVAVGYCFTDLVSAAVAWRVISLDREGDAESNYFNYDMTQDGLGVALGFSF